MTKITKVTVNHGLWAKSANYFTLRSMRVAPHGPTKGSARIWQGRESNPSETDTGGGEAPDMRAPAGV